MRASGFYRLDDRRALDRFQVAHLLAELAVALGQHRDLFGSRHVDGLPLQNAACRALTRVREASGGLYGEFQLSEAE
jgi:hypothetical protein